MDKIESYYTEQFKSTRSRLKLYFRSNFENIRSFIQNRKKKEAVVSSRFKEISSLLKPGLTLCFGITGLQIKEFTNQLIVLGLKETDLMIDSRIISPTDEESIAVVKEFKVQNAISLTGWMFKYLTVEEIAEKVNEMLSFVQEGGQAIFEIDYSLVNYNRLQISRQELIQSIPKVIQERTGCETVPLFISSYDRTKPLIFRVRKGS